MENNIFEELLNSIDTQGISYLLPQNLARHILQHMLDEAQAIDDDLTEEMSTSFLLMAILHLSGVTTLNNKMEVKIKPDDLINYFNIYITTLRMEERRRSGRIMIAEEFLPTPNNIFDIKREVEFVDLAIEEE